MARQLRRENQPEVRVEGRKAATRLVYRAQEVVTKATDQGQIVGHLVRIHEKPANHVLVDVRTVAQNTSDVRIARGGESRQQVNKAS